MEQPTKAITIPVNCRGFTPQKLWEYLNPTLLMKATQHPLVPQVILLADVPDACYLKEVQAHGGLFFADPDTAKLFSSVTLKKKVGEEFHHVGFWPQNKV